MVKHGNRASSSKSGSADVLEVLGVQLDMAVDRVRRAATEVGITFLFAQTFHPSMRFAATARKSLGVATAFNFLGPLTNPARVRSSAIGVADATLAPLMAGVFRNRGDRALVFRGGDGLDELTVTAPSDVWEVRDGEIQEHSLDPLDLDMPRATVEDLRGRDAVYNAGVVRDVLDGAPGTRAPRRAAQCSGGARGSRRVGRRVVHGPVHGRAAPGRDVRGLRSSPGRPGTLGGLRRRMRRPGGVRLPGTTTPPTPVTGGRRLRVAGSQSSMPRENAASRSWVL